MNEQLTDEQLREKFKKIFNEEFDDPNESFMDFLLDLIPKEILLKVLSVGNSYYYSQFKKYK